MSDYPNTEATISEIMGALTLRVLWAIIKTFSGLVLANIILMGIGSFVGTQFGWDSTNGNSAWGMVAAILIGWAYLYMATSKRSLHSYQWYFPRTNGIVSLLISCYAVLSVFLIYQTEFGRTGTSLFLFLYFMPIFIYYTMLCGYYLVMIRRFPDYEYEDFAIPMPDVLFELSLKKGGIDGMQ